MWDVSPGTSSLFSHQGKSLSWPAVLGCEWKSKRKETRHVFAKLNWILKRYIQSACLITNSLWRIKSRWTLCYGIYFSESRTLAMCEGLLFGQIFIFGWAELSISMAELYFLMLFAELAADLILTWLWIFSPICQKPFYFTKRWKGEISP